MTVGPIKTPQDALLFCDYLARFADGDVSDHMARVSNVIRDLMQRLEHQALAAERAEAMKGGAA